MELAHSPDRRHVTVPRSRNVRRDAVPRWQVHRCDLGPSEIARRQALRLTSPLRTVLDCARTVPLAAAVALGDSALRKGLVLLAEPRGGR